MKYIIVGGVAGGATIAARLRRNDENAEIILCERGEYISYANCGLPYYIGGVIKKRDKLLVQTVNAFSKRYRIDIRTLSEVKNIEPVLKAVEILNLKNGERYTEKYDKLILSPGALPIIPPISGIDGSNIFSLRNIDDTDAVKKYLDQNHVRQAVVVGGGFIGLEMVENLHHLGIEVSLVEKADHLMGMLDTSMSSIIHSELKLKGVKLYLGKSVKSFVTKASRTSVTLDNGEVIESDIVIWSIGVRPEVTLAKEAGLEIGKLGGIRVNEYLQTSNIDIYAVGDAIEVLNPIINKPALIPLAGPANKQARIAADNIVFGNRSVYEGTIGTGIVKIFDLTVGFTGMSSKALDANDIENLASFTHSFSHATYYPGAAPISIKITFSPFDGKLYGAQVVGSDGVDKRLDLFAKIIKSKGTIRDLTDLEHAYAPPFSSAKDPVNMAGFVAENILTGKVKVIHWYEIENKISDKALIIDVRTQEEHALGAIAGSINIPVDEIRERLSEIPKDRDIVVYCAIGLRGYIAYRILSQHGFLSVSNLSGGYKTYSLATEKVVFSEYCKVSKSCNDQENTTKSPANRFVDAVGMQCPGPILRLKEEYDNIQNGESIEIWANDPAFGKDIESWSNVTGAVIEKIESKGGITSAIISKKDSGIEIDETGIEERLSNNKTMIVFSDNLDKVLASFIIANGAAAMNKKVTMFFTFWGLNAIKKRANNKIKKDIFGEAFSFILPKSSETLPLSKMNMMGLGRRMMRHIMKKKNINSLESLILQAQQNNIEMIACTMSMDVMGISKEEIIDGVKFAGVATFIEKSDKANMAMFI